MVLYIRPWKRLQGSRTVRIFGAAMRPPRWANVGMLLGFFGLTSLPGSAGSWTQVSLPEGVRFLTALSAGESFLYAAFKDSSGAHMGLYRTPIDSPGVWDFRGLGGQAIPKVIAAGEDDDLLLACTWGEAPRIHYSSDGGSTWSPRVSGIDESAEIYDLGWNGALPGIVYAGSRICCLTLSAGIYYSNDFGLSWEYWEYCPSCYNGGFQKVSVPRHGETVARAGMVGFAANRTFETRDGGVDWEFVAEGGSYFVDLESDVADLERFYYLNEWGIIVWDHRIYQGYFGSPYSVSAGQIGLESPIWKPGTLYLAGVLGEGGQGGQLDVQWTTDVEGGEWESIGEGLPWVQFSGIDYKYYKFVAAYHRPLLFLSTLGAGLWMRDMSDVAGMADLPLASGDWVVSLPRPNPSRGPVALALARDLLAQPIEGEVLDVTGRRVAVLQPGPGGLTWDGRAGGGREVEAGVYLLRVDGPFRSVTRKLLIVR